jgi:hypothetical protein
MASARVEPAVALASLRAAKQRRRLLRDAEQAEILS